MEHCCSWFINIINRIFANVSTKYAFSFLIYKSKFIKKDSTRYSSIMDFFGCYNIPNRFAWRPVLRQRWRQLSNHQLQQLEREEVRERHQAARLRSLPQLPDQAVASHLRAGWCSDKFSDDGPQHAGARARALKKHHLDQGSR